MKTIRFFLVVLLVTFLATNLFAAELAIKTAPKLILKEPVAAPAPAVVAPTPSIATPTIAPAIKVPTTSLPIKEPTLAPAIKAPVLAVPTVKSPTITPVVKAPTTGISVREPALKAPTATIQVREPALSGNIKTPALGTKDPGLMGVRGEQMMDSGKLGNLRGQGLDLSGPGGDLRGGATLPGARDGGLDLSSPANAFGSRGPKGVDRGSIGSQFGLGNSMQNPRGAPTRGGIGDSRLMEGGESEGKKENWHMESEMTDYQDSDGNLVVIQTIKGTNLDTGETITETTVHQDGKSETTVTIEDGSGNVVANQTFSEDEKTDTGGSSGDTSGGSTGEDNSDGSSGNYTAGGENSDGNTSDDGTTTGTNSGYSTNDERTGPPIDRGPEGGEPLPPELQAMVNQMLQRQQRPEADKRSTLINPGSSEGVPGGGTPKGEVSEEGRMNPLINPGDGTAGSPAGTGGGSSVITNIPGTFGNPGNAGVEVVPGGNSLNPDGIPGSKPDQGNTQIGSDGRR